MLCRIGIVLIMLGLAMGDSENLLIPLGVMALGAVLVTVGGAINETRKS